MALTEQQDGAAPGVGFPREDEQAVDRAGLPVRHLGSGAFQREAVLFDGGAARCSGRVPPSAPRRSRSRGGAASVAAIRWLRLVASDHGKPVVRRRWRPPGDLDRRGAEGGTRLSTRCAASKSTASRWKAPSPGGVRASPPITACSSSTRNPPRARTVLLLREPSDSETSQTAIGEGVVMPMERSTGNKCPGTGRLGPARYEAGPVAGPGHYCCPGVPITRAFPASRPAAPDAPSGGAIMRRLRATVPSQHPRDSYLKADPRVTE